MKRYSFDDNEFISLEIVDEPVTRRITTTKGVTNWDWAFYESEHGQEATAQFKQAVESIESLVKKQGWDVVYNINKYYTGFKFGNKVIFSVGWGGTYAWKLKFKIPKEVAMGFKGKNWEFQIYDDSFGDAIFRPLTPKTADIKELEHFYIEAFKKVSGTG